MSWKAITTHVKDNRWAEALVCQRNLFARGDWLAIFLFLWLANVVVRFSSYRTPLPPPPPSHIRTRSDRNQFEESLYLHPVPNGDDEGKEENPPPDPVDTDAAAKVEPVVVDCPNPPGHDEAVSHAVLLQRSPF